MIPKPASRYAVVAAAVCLIGATAQAQTPATAPPMSLEQVMSVEIPSVVGASRFAQQVVDAPATVTIVTSDEIERFGYRTLADILRGVRGFYVNYDRNYSYVGSRGFLRPGDYNSRILLLIDGHRVNDNIYDSATIGTDFPIDLELIDRVEIVRGPSSSLYGTSAFFAVVSVTTRRGTTAHSEADLAAGSQTALEARVAVARRFARAGEVQFSATQVHERRRAPGGRGRCRPGDVRHGPRPGDPAVRHVLEGPLVRRRRLHDQDQGDSDRRLRDLADQPGVADDRRPRVRGRSLRGRGARHLGAVERRLRLVRL